MLTATLITSALLSATSAVEPAHVLPHRPVGKWVEEGWGGGGGGVEEGEGEGEKGVPDDPLGIWADYGGDTDTDDDLPNSCFLVSWEYSVKAAYLCQDGTLWQVNIDMEGDRCVYNRTLTNSFGEAVNNGAAINCKAAREWIQGLVQTDVIAGIPDTRFFNLTTSLPLPGLTPTSIDNTTTEDSQLATSGQGCT